MSKISTKPVFAKWGLLWYEYRQDRHNLKWKAENNSTYFACASDIRYLNCWKQMPQSIRLKLQTIKQHDEIKCMDTRERQCIYETEQIRYACHMKTKEKQTDECL